jgi:crotonobetainyl-CoA:carnitine CoA-transferase CaiB-like acyl-CoA transferase
MISRRYAISRLPGPTQVGQAVVLRGAEDNQLRANGFIAELVDVDGNVRELVTAPVQFDETPASIQRGPQFAEHTDEVLRELGHDDEKILAAKLSGAVI